jgi:hypothetical protein
MTDSNGEGRTEAPAKEFKPRNKVVTLIRGYKDGSDVYHKAGSEVTVSAKEAKRLVEKLRAANYGHS